ncbi:diguanylate cyclase [Exilibacterium tricleocarpae]|uniref:diguanylate cyclase n=1 Tax=Exilibacterium tricleocarpae TaxID=2591008 RepID=A0A545TQJ4_9GAMM|nr:diguanylate cyclase [Exilibacterium tricleocarpae]TQV79495.1 diguanylate cyclase [Exilibacterium tricleocarpae]
MKILLVEDSATLRHAHCSYLRSAGHTPIIAESGEEALQLVEKTPVDMVIMDVEMPGLDGFETTRLMREWLGNDWIPIIFVTGKSDDQSYLEGIDAGGDDYLIKPVSPAILGAKIKAMERIAHMRQQLHQLNTELETLSQRDALTQVYNRRSFDDLSRQQWLLANRRQEPMAVLMIDIDHFKLYNDFYGQLSGDDCLVKVARAIQNTLRRPADLLARYGGGEFIILLPDTNLTGARQVADAICVAIRDLRISHQMSKTSSVVTASIGAACTSHYDGRTLQDLINQADKALYKAKYAGRDRAKVVEFSPLKSLLVADDDAQTLDLLGDELVGRYQMAVAGNGEECLEMAQSLLPDMILLDIRLPGMDGLAVCQQLKRFSDTASIPIVLISGMHKAEQLRLGKEVGANDCLEKPLDRQRLLAKLDNYLTGVP